jgi:hypothetical protein
MVDGSFAVGWNVHHTRLHVVFTLQYLVHVIVNKI